MASADYSVGTKVTADVSNFEKGMNKAEKSLKGFSDKLANSIDRLGKKGLIGSMANVTLAVGGLTKSFNTVIKFAKDVGKAINECTEAYKGQIIAERALDTAIQNNPFITGASSKALKQFASDMQRVTNYGDEELIPMMTNLVSLGRTESEVMQIMSVAMDMSAGMGISLDTAITQLNATLNGNIGRLGQQNAELKDLTEEELKQGKAIEILGEKFKGLSSATADTSKQLQNIKGDFKEALGQFTLPSSDMWNKFWAGFYEKGIEVINKINAFMDSQIIGKKLANAITEQIARINPADIGGRIDYTRNVLRVIGDNELEALKNYLSGLRNLSAEQEIILKRIKAEEDSRYQSSINAKKEAEDKKKQADAEAQITAELQKQEEVAKKKTDWASKLLDQRIEMLETERDRAMQLAEEEGQETYTIWRDYNEKILELKLERLEKEKEKALAEEGLTAEDKIAIEEYYSNETKKIYNDLGNYKKKKNEEEKKDEKSKFAVMLEIAKRYAENIKNVFSKIASTIKNVFDKIKNIFSSLTGLFSKLFEFNPDEVLNSLLEIEDAVLTFFVETLPQLPVFFESAFNSVLVLVQTLMNTIDWDSVGNFLNQIVDVFVDNAPAIVKGIVDIFSNIVETVTQVFIESAPEIVNAFGDIFFSIIESLPGILNNVLSALGEAISAIGKYLADNGARLADDCVKIVQSIVDNLIKFISNGGWKNLLEALLAIQQALEKSVTENIEEIGEAIIDGLPDLMNFLKNSIISASKTLAKIAPTLLKVITEIIATILEVAFDPEVIESSFDVVENVIAGLIQGIITLIAKLIPVAIKLILNFPKMLAGLIEAIVTGLIKGFLEVDWIQVIVDIFTGFVDAFKDFFGIHSPSTLFEDFGTNMVEGLVIGLKGISESVMIILQPFFDLIESVIKDIIDGVGKIIDSLTKLTEVSFDGFNTGLETIINGLTEITSTSFDGVNEGLRTVGSSLNTLTKTSINGLNEGLKTVADLFKSITEGSLVELNKSLTTLLDFFTKITELSFSGLTKSIEALSEPIKAVGKVTIAIMGAVAKTMADVHNTLRDIIKSVTSIKVWTPWETYEIGGVDIGKVSTPNIDDYVKLIDALNESAKTTVSTKEVEKGINAVKGAKVELVDYSKADYVRGPSSYTNPYANFGEGASGRNRVSEFGGTTINQNVTFNNLQDTTAFAMIQELKQYNRQMAINGVL